MDIKFYRCKHCGNIIIKLVDSSVPVVCCGEKMVELIPGEIDGAVEKHVPVIERVNDEVTVKVGAVEHPMTEAHYIQFVVLLTNKGYQVKHFTPLDKPIAKFMVSADEEVVSVYEYCNLHGLWKK